jgi:hypothetical protein
MLCGHAVPFSETWPTSGSMRNGQLYPPRTQGRRTAGSVSSSPGGLLPTPLVTNRAGMSPSRSSIDGKRGADLGPVIGALLKTPTAQLAVNGGSQHPDKRRAGGHGPTLADQVEHQLLPTPTAWARGGPNQRGSSGDLMLPSAVMKLLPTPSAADALGGHLSRSGERSSEILLPGIAKALSTGETTTPPSADGSTSLGVPRPGQLSLGEPESA